MPHMAEAYWADSLSAENSAAASLQPHAMAWAAWSMGQADPADLVQNADGSASATLTVPNNVSLSRSSNRRTNGLVAGGRCDHRKRRVADSTGAQRFGSRYFH